MEVTEEMLKAIEDAAGEAATPYAWRAELFQHDTREDWKVCGDADDEWVADCGIGGNAPQTAAYIALMSPDTAQALVRELSVTRTALLHAASERESAVNGGVTGTLEKKIAARWIETARKELTDGN